MYIRRIIESTIVDYVKNFPVVALTGPRQSGKSTTLQNLFPNYTYVTFDDFVNVDLFNNDPVRFLEESKGPVIFDEAQKVPDIFNMIKLRVDKERNTKGKYILTGSGNFLLMKNITETLAGRIGLLTMLPFQYAEVPLDQRYDSIYLGAYPEMVVNKYINWNNWYSSYVDTYLTKDLRNFTEIGDIRDFTRFIRLLAARTSQILNFSEIAAAVGVTVKTIKRWTSILEASYVVFLLEPYHNNFGKRIIKSPKVYFYDTGLVSFFCGISGSKLFESGPLAGPIFENYVISEMLKNEHSTRSGKRFYYYRTSNGEEVDLLVEDNMDIRLVEIKNTGTFNSRLLKTMERFPGNARNSTLVYRGKDIRTGGNMSVRNYQELLSDLNY